MTFPAGASDVGWSSMSSPTWEPYNYQQLEAYYAGRQPLSFLSPQVSAALSNRIRTLIVNWPRLVIDSLEERLDVEGFRLASDQPADRALWDIWQANRLDVQSQLCHLEALLHGRSYVLVWADDTDPAIPQITVESSAWMSVAYDPSGTRVTRAVKRWVLDGTSYATVYLPDSVERYVGSTGVVIPADVAVTLESWSLREEPISHDLGQVPVIPFVNRPSLARPFGKSEIADIIPIADAINKLSTDMMVSAEYHATPRRWATGIDLGSNDNDAAKVREQALSRWTQAETGKVWLSDSDAAKFGQFREADLANFVRGIELLTSQIAALAGLPPQELGLNPQGNPASADAIIANDAAKVKRVQRKQRVFGERWEDVMRLAMIVRDGQALSGAERMETIWRDPNTPTIAQKTDAALKLNTIGMPFRQNLEDLGYSPTAIDRINVMATTDSLARVSEQVAAADEIVKTFGMSRAAALAMVGLEQAALYESKVEARQPALSTEVVNTDLGATGVVPPSAPTGQ